MKKKFFRGKLGQWLVVIVGVVASLTAGLGFGWPLGALKKVEEGEAGFKMTSEEESWMVTAVYLGNVVSPVPAGLAMDRLGRKRSLVLLSSLSVASWGLLLAVHAPWGLYLARFLAGSWSGVVHTIVFVYIGETVEAGDRGAAASLVAALAFLGSLQMSALGPFVSYDTLNAVALLAPFLLLLGLLAAPESPYFFLTRNDEGSARASLLSVREPGSVENDLQRIKEGVRAQTEAPSTYLDLVRTKANRKALLIVLALGLIQRGSGVSVLLSYAAVVLPESFLSPETSALGLSVVWVVSGLLAVKTADLFGRRIMFTLSCLGSGLVMALAASWFYLREKTQVDLGSTHWVPVVAFAVHACLNSLGLTGIPGLVQGEVFPVTLKAQASALSAINMALVSAVQVKIFFPLRGYFGVYFNFAINSTVAFLGAVYAMLFMFETKGKTLEEIQNILVAENKN